MTRTNILPAIILLWITSFGWAMPKMVFPVSNETIDVVIPAIEKDLPILDRCIEGIKQHGKNIGRVIVISPSKLTHHAEWFCEKGFPFTKKDIALEIFESEAQADAFLSQSSRIGWIYQQFLKLYAPFVIPEISSNVLVLDADTIFFRDVTFMDEKGNAFYNVGYEYHYPYFSHISRLIPGLQRAFPQYSGICHHMLFQRCVLEDLFDAIESCHGKEAWRAIASCIDPKEAHYSSMSEYELYFNYVLSRTSQVMIRPLQWANVSSLGQIANYRFMGFDYISCHSWMR